MHKTVLSFTTLMLLALLWGCSFETPPEEHLQNAKTYLAAGNDAAAVLELKNALQKDGYLAEARWLLGKTYLVAGDTASAEKELERAMWMDWDPNEIVPAYAAALLAEEKYAEVDKLSEDGLSDTARAELYTSKAMAKVAQNQNQDAKALIEKTLEIEPDLVSAKLAKAKLEINLGEIDKAEETLGAMIEQEEDNAKAWHALGEVALLQRDPEKASKALDKALKYDPGNMMALYQRAMTGLQTGDIKAARRSSALLMRRSPKNPGANFIQGYLDLTDKNSESAAKRLAMAEPLTQQYPQIALFLATAEMMNGNLEIASAAADRFNALVPDSIRGRKLVATIKIEEGDAAKAEDLIRPVTVAAPEDADALRLLATALLAQNKTEEGISMLARVAQLRPDSAQAQVRLGAGLLMNGQPEDAKLHLESALELEPAFLQADLLLVLSMMDQGEPDEALAAAKKLAARQPEDTLPLNLVGWVYSRMGDEKEAQKIFREILQKTPNDPGANHSLAKFAIQAEDYDTAIGHYNSILKDKPDHLPTHIQLSLIDALQSNEAAVIDRLQNMIDKYPDILRPRTILARYYLRSGRGERVPTAFIGLDESQKNETEVLQLLALAQLAGKEHSEALFTLEKLNESEPGSAPNHYITAVAAAGAGDAPLAETHLNSALELNVDHLPSRLALAKLLWGLQRHDEVVPHLEILAKALPDNAEVLLLQAAMQERAGNSAQALKLAAKAHQNAPTTNTIITLGNYHERAGDSASAQALYKPWIKSHPEDSIVRLKLAADEMNTGGDATAQYREIIRLDPNNVIALNNLAWLLQESDPEQALDFARRADEIAPDNSAVLDTLALAELANGNLVQATRTIRRALELDPDQPSMLYHRAMIESANGQKDEAIYTLETLFAQDIEYPETVDAQALYNSLKK